LRGSTQIQPLNLSSNSFVNPSIERRSSRDLSLPSALNMTILRAISSDTPGSEATSRREAAKRFRGSFGLRATTKGLNLSKVFGPIPGTESNSSTDPKGPFLSRQPRMALAKATPTPGMRRSSSSVAEFMSTGKG